MDWKTYIERTRNSNPRPLLVRAAAIAKKGCALDFGAGGFRDSKYLANLGFAVTALDANQESEDNSDSFRFARSTFEQFHYPRGTYTLISGQYAFPFVQKQQFKRVWEDLYLALQDGGVLCGQFFGFNDDWSLNPTRAPRENAASTDTIMFHSLAEVEKLLEKYKILFVEETEYDKPTNTGALKHWHIISFIAQKVSSESIATT